MLKFRLDLQEVVLEYAPERNDGGWIWEQLTEDPHVAKLSSVFRFTRSDLLVEPSEDIANAFDEINGFTYRFRLAQSDGDYWRIAGRKLAIDDDVLIAKGAIPLARKIFAAHRDISIFRHLAKVIGTGTEIVIGGDAEARPGVLPVAVFKELLAKFPNSGELDRYADARIANIVGEYFDPERDFRGAYEAYLDRRKPLPRGEPLRAEALLETEIDKFELIRDTLAEWLKTGGRSEEQWQKQLLAFLPLIFPKYVAVIEKLPIADRYTTPGTLRTRQIDLALVDVNGNIDVIEIKKPADNVLLRRTRYRDNYVPTGDLSGTIMQAEKYLFHLGKGGIAAEDKLTARYQAVLPPGLKIRITNPKAICILGRDRNADGSAALNDGQLADLEIIKRKYTNMIDIITYDDLLRRLERIIASLRRRAEDGLNAPPP